MISLPNRVLQAMDLMEKGESVPWGKLAFLQVLDLVVIGRQFVEDAVQRDRDADDVFRNWPSP